MAEYTLTYSAGVEGWPSFYSYVPHWMIGMNNYFYTFGTEKDPITGNAITGGNIYRHNTNAVRNNYYGFQYTSKLTSVFNDIPLQNKLFKTLNLESDTAWSATMQTDIQTSGFIEADWFEKKEASWFAFVRNSEVASEQLALRSLNGIGKSAAISGPVAATVVDFSISPLVSIGSILSVGDVFYYSLPPTYDTPVLLGTVTAINVDLPGSVNQVVVDATLGTVPLISDPYCFYIKNSIAESHGVLGHYCLFEVENTDTTATELFAVESEIMKSYP
jgi:hypothetical protein